MRILRYFCLLLLMAGLLLVVPVSAQEVISLEGSWDLSLNDSLHYDDYVMLPGSLQTNGKSSAEKPFVGKAWYRKHVYIPREWRKNRVTLFLERPHVETRVYINGQAVGHQQSLSTPHQYDVTNYLVPGQRNAIAVCVNNGFEQVSAGQGLYGIADPSQGNWNGIAGRMELRAQSQWVSFKQVKVNPEPVNGDLLVTVEVESELDPLAYYDDMTVMLMSEGKSENVFYLGSEDITEKTMHLRIPVGEHLAAWDEFSPVLYRLALGTKDDFYETTLGIRKVRAQGRQLFINDRPLFLRGTVENGYFPDTGYPPTDEAFWMSIFTKLKEYGLNHMRFRSYCPPEAAFAAADKLGVYLQPEVTLWPSQELPLNSEQKIAARLLEESKRVVDTYGHHPSFILKFPQGDKDSIPGSSPVIAYEQGRWCAFPNFSEITEYTGVHKAHHLERLRDLLRKNGIEQRADEFLMASGKLQTWCYKNEIERNLCSSDFAGFQLMSLNDYCAQEVAPIGPLNAHWREKGYAFAKDWIEFCSPVVMLARFPRFVYTNADTLRVPVEVYNALYGTISPIRKNYYISEGEQVVAGGALSSDSIPVGKHCEIGTVVYPLDSISEPRKLTLTVRLGRQVPNHWDFWVYPKQDSTLHSSAANIHITDALDARALAVLKKGGKVLLTAAGKVQLGGDVIQHYLPLAWDGSLSERQASHTVGTYINSQHPLFRYGFPTDDWGNQNWKELLDGAQVMNLMELPADYQPPIQPIDSWLTCRKLGMLIEANVLNGKLLMTTMDITNDLDQRVVARQMRHAILDYMNSDDFKPALTLDAKIITNFYTKDNPQMN